VCVLWTSFGQRDHRNGWKTCLWRLLQERTCQARIQGNLRKQDYSGLYTFVRFSENLNLDLIVPISSNSLEVKIINFISISNLPPSFLCVIVGFFFVCLDRIDQKFILLLVNILIHSSNIQLELEH